MAKQQTFAGEAWKRKGKVTRRECFLAEMDAVIPWQRVLELIRPRYYASSGQGRKPHDLEQLLRIYFLQQESDLSDSAAEDAIDDSESMRRFARVELGDDRVPDESTILRFHHLLEREGLTEGVFEVVKDLLAEKRLMLRSGTSVDAMIIAAPSSTKNETEELGSGDEAALGLHQDTLPRDREEPGPSADDVRPGEPLRRPPPTATTAGERCTVSRASRGRGRWGCRAQFRSADRGIWASSRPLRREDV